MYYDWDKLGLYFLVASVVFFLIAIVVFLTGNDPRDTLALGSACAVISCAFSIVGMYRTTR